MEDREKKIRGQEKREGALEVSSDGRYVRCGQVGVKMEFSESARTLGDCLWNVLCRSEEWK